MSAALQFPLALEASASLALCGQAQQIWQKRPVVSVRPQQLRQGALPAETLTSLAFYRKHTEALLRRYLYASMQVGRAPSILSDPIARGWVSSRPVRTFEDAVIFVLDVEKCLEALSSLDREMIARVVLQEYTQAEAAVLLGMATRTIGYKFPLALDHLTEKLLQSGLLVLPDEGA